MLKKQDEILIGVLDAGIFYATPAHANRHQLLAVNEHWAIELDRLGSCTLRTRQSINQSLAFVPCIYLCQFLTGFYPGINMRGCESQGGGAKLRCRQNPGFLNPVWYITSTCAIFSRPYQLIRAYADPLVRLSPSVVCVCVHCRKFSVFTGGTRSLTPRCEAGPTLTAWNI